MTNLKINSTSTPYWCVVVPVEIYEVIIPDGYTLVGAITLEGMDEGVREVIDYVNNLTNLPVHKLFYEGAMTAFLQHNQITLTADQKAVVVKQIT